MNDPSNPILTAKEIADDLRISKTQVYRLMSGEVDGITPIPTLPLGRKKVVMRASFEAWKRANEKNRAIVGSDSKEGAVDAA